MLLSKKYLTVGIVGVAIVSSTVIGKANYDKSQIFKNKENVRLSYENIISIDGVDHVRISYSNGEYVDMYRDTERLLDQTDHYDENGNLMSRILVLNNGEEAISIGEDNGVYSGVRLELSEDAKQENKKILEKSMLESYFIEDVESGLDINWESSFTEDENIIKYTSKNHNLYIDKKTNKLLKREIFMNGELYQTIEYNLINRNSRSGQDLFKIDTPLTSNMRNYINLSNIDIVNSKSDPDVPIKNAKG